MKSSRIGGRRAIAIVLLAWLGWATPQPFVASSFPEAAGDAGAASSEPSRRADLQQLAASYVDDYQKQLAAIVADEVYVQEIRAQVPPEEGAPRSRTLRGEVFFLFAAAEREWMAIRDVKEVDGVPLTGTRDVRATLRTLPAAQVADRMKSYNARYNIGRITRDINEPTLALLVLDATHRDRFKFKADKPRQAGDRRLVPLSFKERERPTLIRSTAGKPIYTSGELMVEPESGRIWQSTLNAVGGRDQGTADDRVLVRRAPGPAAADRVPGTIRAGNRDQLPREREAHHHARSRSGRRGRPVFELPALRSAVADSIGRSPIPFSPHAH